MKIINILFENRWLIFSLIRRDIASRYRGSVAGIAWSFLTPLIMLLIYTFVFSVVLKARWNTGVAVEDNASFALILFVGLIVHGFLSEVIGRSTTLISGNPSYVKKIVFPLEIMTFVTIGSVLFHTLVSFFVFLMVALVITGGLSWTFFYLPLVMLPLIIMCLGFSWILSALGVYLRDISQLTAMVSTMLLFLSPVFYPVSALPGKFQTVVYINPLSYFIEESRNVLIFGNAPDFIKLSIYFLVSIACAQLGYLFFRKLKKGFADVL